MKHSARYLVSAIRLDKEGNLIERVRAFKSDPGEISPQEEIDRKRLLRMIRAGYHFATVRKDGRGVWRVCEGLKKVNVEEEPYIRTDGETAPSDHIEKLPEY